MRDWRARIEEARREGIHAVEVLHVDGRRIEGQLGGLTDGPSGHPQVVVRDFAGVEYRLYFPTIRAIRW